MDDVYYPLHLLPQEDWMLQIKTDDILHLCENALIGRRFEGELHDFIDTSLGEDMPVLKDKALSFKDIPNLSTSLLGTLHKIEDFHFVQKERGSDNWTGGSVDISIFTPNTDFYRIEGNLVVLGWIIEELDGRKFPYQQPLPKKKNYDACIAKLKSAYPEEDVYVEEYEKLAVNANNNRVIEFEGTVKVNHIPTNLNYWHFTIDLYPKDNPTTPLKNSSGKWRAELCENVRDYLKYSFNILSDMMLPPVINDWESLVRG